MIEKDPNDVIHKINDLEEYMDRYLQTANTTFEKWVKRFSKSFYHERNRIILAMATGRVPRNVLEFACAGPYLAQLLITNIGSIEKYTCSNFSMRMAEFCSVQLINEPRCEAAVIDADITRSMDMHRKHIDKYDMFITTSLEHIQFDRELVREFPLGSSFVFSVAKFDDPEHFRIYENLADIESRYAGLLSIEQSRETMDGRKLIVWASRR